jgi:hypothetical protein
MDEPRFDSRQCNFFLTSIASRSALGPTQPPMKCVPWGTSQGVNRPEREADHSSPIGAKVKNSGAIRKDIFAFIYYESFLRNLYISTDQYFVTYGHGGQRV